MNNNESVLKVIEEIQKSRSQQSASQRDEVRVAQAMMNDKSFAVDVYGKSGVENQYNPALALRASLADQIHSATKISKDEAAALADAYEYTKKDAETQVDFSKEFVNTYITTGRKLPLGTREFSDVSLIEKNIPEGERTYPCKVGVNEDGTDRYGKGTTTVPAHKTIRVLSSCPDHIRNKK